MYHIPCSYCDLSKVWILLCWSYLQLSVLDVFLTTLWTFQLFNYLHSQFFMLTFFFLKNLIFCYPGWSLTDALLINLPFYLEKFQMPYHGLNTTLWCDLCLPPDSHLVSLYSSFIVARLALCTQETTSTTDSYSLKSLLISLALDWCLGI